MTERDNAPKHEPLSEDPNDPWRVFADTKIPMADIPFDPHNPTTFKRLVFNPHTGDRFLIAETDFLKIRNGGGDNAD